MIEFENVKIKFNWIKIIEEWSFSHTMKKVQFFLKFANFYHRFIENYFKIAALLHKLIKNVKKKKWKLSFTLINIVKNTFNAFKAKFINALLFTHFNFNKQICIKSNALNVTVIIIIS